MTNTDILLEDLEDVLEQATSFPMSKKSLVDVEKIKIIIEDIRLNTPQETKQAKAIVDNRNNILNEAKIEAENIIKKAQEQARQIIAKDEITKLAQAEANQTISQAQAQATEVVTAAQSEASEILSNASSQANEMVTTAQARSREMMNAARNYVNESLEKTDVALYNALTDIRKVREGFMNTNNAQQ